MSEGNGKLDSMKGNKMNKTKIGSGGLVELVEIKTGLGTIGAYAYALTLVWALADNKLKAKIVKMIDEESN